MMVSGLRLPHPGTSAIELAALATDTSERRRRATRRVSRSLTVWQNEAEALNNQLSLMLQNGFAGFALVFLVLALFLEMQQALSSASG